MTEFDDLFAGAASALLGPFGEDIVYRPSGGLPRTITAIVDRNPPETITGTEVSSETVLQITVLDDPELGIAGSELNTARDRLDVPRRRGQKPEPFSVWKLLGDTGGMLEFTAR